MWTSEKMKQEKIILTASDYFLPTNEIFLTLHFLQCYDLWRRIKTESLLDIKNNFLRGIHVWKYFWVKTEFFHSLIKLSNLIN